MTATISWYLIGSFARGMDYDSDGLLRAEWPTSGHFELTPMVWTTMHLTRFVKPGWRLLPCTDKAAPTGRCALQGGGNYAALASPDSSSFAIIAHAFRHDTSQCIRKDPPDWHVAATQSVSFHLHGVEPSSKVHVWRSCTGWDYPSANDGWFEQQPDTTVSVDGKLTVSIEVNCMYTFTNVGGVTKPSVPIGVPGSAAFPLPYSDDFDGLEVGAEAPFFGDQMGKFEIVAASGGRSGTFLLYIRGQMKTFVPIRVYSTYDTNVLEQGTLLGSNFPWPRGLYATAGTVSRSA
jgi:galactosylceramidase